MTALGGTLKDLLREHNYQKDKRFFPVFNKVRTTFEPVEPTPNSSLGICAGSPDEKAWVVLDGIAIAPQDWRFKGRRCVLRSSGTLASAAHYSQGVLAGPYIFLAGQIPIDTSKQGNPLISAYEDIPKEGRFLQTGFSHPDTRNGPIASQSWFAYNHIRLLLKEAGCGMEDIANVTVFLQSMNDFPTFHEIHRHFFPNCSPALTVTEFRQVGHKGTLIEIEVTAMRSAEGLERRFIQETGSMKSSIHSALAVIAGPLVFVSGQSGFDSDGKMIQDPSGLPKALRFDAVGLARVNGRPEATCQAISIFENLKAILKEAGVSLSSMAKIVLYLDNFKDFIAFDSVCKHYCKGPKPSLACVMIPKVSPFPGARICIEAIAVKE
jgi:enamine deaminase RidA (YjgF/YER057c/UK114 family)